MHVYNSIITETYLRMLATSMISGTSSEKPALERFLLIDHIWSAYEVTGEVIMNKGATCVTAHLTRVIALQNTTSVSATRL